VTRRVAEIAGGFAALSIAVASPVSHMDHHLLTLHMVQHLLLMVVAAPLILLGMRPPIPLDLKLHPAFCWIAGTVTVMVWHVPVVFELAWRSRYWHAFEHASFFIAGILFWWPVIRPGDASSRWWVPVYLFLATLPCDALSAFLTFCGRVVYGPYRPAGDKIAGATGTFYLSPLEDQALAGALMWVAVTFAYLIPALAALAELLSHGESLSKRQEVLLDR
jgi:putative membrane protein